MVEINLLPKEFQKKGLSLSFDKTFLYVLGAAAALILIMAAVSIYQSFQLGSIDDKIEIAQAKTDAYKDEIAQIDNLNALKEKVLARMKAIKILDKNRTYWVSLLSDLTGRIPSHVWLTGFVQAGAKDTGKKNVIKGQDAENAASKNTVLEGYTFSLNALAAFLIQLNRSDYFDNLSISNIKLEDVEDRAMYNFKINCELITTVDQNKDKG